MWVRSFAGGTGAYRTVLIRAKATFVAQFDSWHRTPQKSCSDPRLPRLQATVLRPPQTSQEQHLNSSLKHTLTWGRRSDFQHTEGQVSHTTPCLLCAQAVGCPAPAPLRVQWQHQAVGCLVPAPLRVRWQHLVSQTKQQQQLPPTQPGQSKPEQILAPPPSAAQAAQQPPAPTTAQAANTNSHTDPNTTAPTPAAPPVAAPVAATAASTGVGEGGSRRTKGTAAPSDTSPSMAPVHTHPTPHPNAVSASHVQQQQHPSSSTANTTNTTPASAAPATTTAKSSNQRANHVLAQLAAAPPIIPSRLMHHSGSGSSAKAVQARTVLPHTVGVGHQRVGMPLTVGRPQQATAGAQQQLRCPVCATKHSSGINLARCEVRHRGGEAGECEPQWGDARVCACACMHVRVCACEVAIVC
eukprot:1159010-Pelagomonas_calceolata.AAC.14